MAPYLLHICGSVGVLQSLYTSLI